MHRLHGKNVGETALPCLNQIPMPHTHPPAEVDVQLQVLLGSVAALEDIQVAWQHAKVRTPELRILTDATIRGPEDRILVRSILCTELLRHGEHLHAHPDYISASKRIRHLRIARTPNGYSQRVRNPFHVLKTPHITKIREKPQLLVN